MSVGENVPRALAAAGIVAVFAAGTWLVPLLPVTAQQPSARERFKDQDKQALNLRDTLKKLEAMRAELDRQRQALDEQRLAVEAQAKALQRAMQRFEAETAKKLSPAATPKPAPKNIDIEVEVKDLLRQIEHSAGKKGEGVKVIVIRQGERMKPAPQPDLGHRLDRVQHMLMEALQEVQSLRREMGHAPGAPRPVVPPPTYRTPQGNFAPPNPAPRYPVPAPPLPADLPPPTPAVP